MSRRWLITGVSSGLGRSLAEAALARGDAVAGTLRKADQVRAFEQLAPGRAHGLLIDLKNYRRVPGAVGEAVERLGGLDIVVNNAGYALAGAVEEVTLFEAEAILATNFLAPLAVIQAALPHLRHRRRGHIINISSLAALEGYRGLALYCATKSALASLSEVLSIEARPFGIHATSVEPTGMRTRFAGASLRLAARRFVDYRGMRAEMEEAFARSDGRQPSDPAKAAEQLLALADMPEPPTHFALGDNAFDRIVSALDARLADYARFAPQRGLTELAAKDGTPLAAAS